MDHAHITKVTTLKKKENDAAASALLNRACAQVQPIMGKRGWTCPLVAEFMPKNETLHGLNHNKGRKIQVRLRRGTDNSFYEFNHVLGTLLHELVHIEISAHSAAFYKMLDVLWEEAEALMDKGITGNGNGAGVSGFSFTGEGKNLDPSRHNVPRDKARQIALDAAIRRSKTQHAPQVLGGNSSKMKEKSPRELAAEAAERRAADNKWCGSCHDHHHDDDDEEEDDDGEGEDEDRKRSGAAAAAAGNDGAGPADTRPIAAAAGGGSSSAASTGSAGAFNASAPQPAVPKLPESIKKRCETAAAKIQTAPPAVAARAFATIARVVGDVAEDPANRKFQRLSFSNAKLNTVLWLVDGTFDLLSACGFGRGIGEVDGDAMVLGPAALPVDIALFRSVEAWILALPICKKVTVVRRNRPLAGSSGDGGSGHSGSHGGSHPPVDGAPADSHASRNSKRARTDQAGNQNDSIINIESGDDDANGGAAGAGTEDDHPWQSMAATQPMDSSIICLDSDSDDEDEDEDGGTNGQADPPARAAGGGPTPAATAASQLELALAASRKEAQLLQEAKDAEEAELKAVLAMSMQGQ